MPTPDELIEQSLSKLRTAKRFSHTSNSYRKDNPGEYAKVIAYLDGGARPSDVVTDMGLHAILEEDARRALSGSPPPPPPPSGNPVPVGIPGTWNLVFRDEFDAPLDLGVWTPGFWWSPDQDCQSVSTGELVCYQFPQAFTRDGNLVLKLEKRQPFLCDGHTLQYVSGMVTSGGNNYGKPPGFNYIYGYAESRFKLPRGKALWPGFWTSPQNFAWPPEIDFAELTGNNVNYWSGNYHYSDQNGQHQAANNSWIGPDFTADYHVFGCDWKPGEIIWYVDGVERARFTSSFVASEPMYLMFTLSLGGVQGSPDPTWTGGEMLIDYVRVWKRA